MQVGRYVAEGVNGVVDGKASGLVRGNWTCPTAGDSNADPDVIAKHFTRLNSA